MFGIIITSYNGKNIPDIFVIHCKRSITARTRGYLVAFEANDCSEYALRRNMVYCLRDVRPTEVAQGWLTIRCKKLLAFACQFASFLEILMDWEMVRCAAVLGRCEFWPLFHSLGTLFDFRQS